MPAPRIAIIGAGPAGLTLARILHVNNIPCTVFEGDTSSTARTQGGSLDLHAESGQAALTEAGLLDDFNRFARPEGQDFVLRDRHGKAHVDMRDLPRGRPEIDRTVLRQMLLDSLPEGTVKWGCHVSGVEVGTITFRNSEPATGFDLIVGADGAWSKVRPHLTTVPPYYSGVSGIELNHANIEQAHPELTAMVGNGSHFVFGEEKRKVLLSQRAGDGSLRTYAFMHKPEGYLRDVNVKDTATVKKLLLEEYADFAPEITRLIIEGFNADGGDTMTSRPLYMLPVGIRWPTQPGLTVIGDAAHVMTPFTGEGVNQAMQDAMELAHAIVPAAKEVSGDQSASSALAPAVAKYEQELFVRANEFTNRTWQSTLSRFAPGGLKELRARVTKGIRAKLGPDAPLPKNIKISDDEL